MKSFDIRLQKWCVAFSDNCFTQQYQTGLEERQLQNFDYALGMIAWVHIFTALESTLTPTACYAAPANPWTETTEGNVPDYLIGQSVSDIQRPGQNDGKLTVFFL